MLTSKDGYTDPDGRISEITYFESRNEKNIFIIIPVKYAEGTTDEQKSFFKLSAENAWSGTFGDYNVRLTVEERDSGSVNEIVFNDEDSAGISNVRNHERMTLYTNTSQTDEQSELEYTISHEVGHLMNLPDHYIENTDFFGRRYTSPEGSLSNNIMGEFYGSVEEKNIIELLGINNVIAKRVIGYDD